MSNFKLNLGTYGHNLLAYERDARGANCAYEHGLSKHVDGVLIISGKY